MSTQHLLSPEIRDAMVGLPNGDVSLDNLAVFRSVSAAQVVMGDPGKHRVVREEVFIDTTTGQLRGLLYKPEDTHADLPGYVHIHGGGYLIGSPEGSDLDNIALCAELGLVVLSVDYRLAPEHPVPAALDDCYAGLAWLHDNASRFNVDVNRIAVGGESAGGGLAAALAIKARDEGKYSVCHQHLTYPMLDNLTGSASQPADPLVGEFVWTSQRNQFGWDCYLGGSPAAAPQVPARLENYAGLPPAWILTGQLDLFRDENITYAQKMMSAGVSVELQVFAGACHGFQAVYKSQIARRYRQEHRRALSAGLDIVQAQ